jgi:enoyl-[acyl-carrier-protein] reductase (NADH)
MTGELVGEVIMVTGAAVSLGVTFADHFTKVATTDDVAHAASFLLSDRSSFMTGREFVVDGGASLAPIQ